MLFKYTDPSAEKYPLLFQSRTLSGLSFLHSMQFWGWMIFCMGIEGRLNERFKISVIGVSRNLNGLLFFWNAYGWLLKKAQNGSDHSISHLSNQIHCKSAFFLIKIKRTLHNDVSLTSLRPLSGINCQYSNTDRNWNRSISSNQCQSPLKHGGFFFFFVQKRLKEIRKTALLIF